MILIKRDRQEHDSSLKPLEPGSKEWLKAYRDRLFCEIIVD